MLLSIANNSMIARRLERQVPSAKFSHTDFVIECYAPPKWSRAFYPNLIGTLESQPTRSKVDITPLMPVITKWINVKDNITSGLSNALMQICSLRLFRGV